MLEEARVGEADEEGGFAGRGVADEDLFLDLWRRGKGRGAMGGGRGGRSRRGGGSEVSGRGGLERGKGRTKSQVAMLGVCSRVTDVELCGGGEQRVVGRGRERRHAGLGGFELVATWFVGDWGFADTEPG